MYEIKWTDVNTGETYSKTLDDLREARQLRLAITMSANLELVSPMKLPRQMVSHETLCKFAGCHQA